jgi:GMP synthase-like glutamine amidotransferase
MKLGILVTGAPPEPLRDRFGTYDRMIRDLFGPAYTYESYDTPRGELPSTPDSCDAYVISGSPASVYEPLDWIRDLTAFVQSASGRVPMIGICFGHQLLAQAFGGKVIRSPKGLGAGLHTYDVCDRAEWLGDVARIVLPALHNDQVVELPPDARLHAGSDFTPNGLLSYPQRRAISVQCHPEFSHEYSRALVELHRGKRLTDEQAEQALRSLDAPHDGERVAAGFRRFLAEQVGSH